MNVPVYHYILRVEFYQVNGHASKSSNIVSVKDRMAWWFFLHIPSGLWGLTFHQCEGLYNFMEVWWLVPTRHFAQILYQEIYDVLGAASGRHY